MTFENTFIEKLRRLVPISRIIGERVVWDMRKTSLSRQDWWSCCPFHAEKSSSFHCEDSKGLYHCFGCGASGDHFRFLCELDGLHFRDAVEKIAAMAGIPVPESLSSEPSKKRSDADLYTVLEWAAAFFERQLQEPVGARARAYLQARGITVSAQRFFRLGYAPPKRDALKEFLLSKGATRISIEAAGLSVFENVPVPYDRFRDRIMFPVNDLRGRTIAFGGRDLSGDAPAKYLNSPENALFQKKEVLYNFAHARAASRKKEAIIVVEGYMDVISLHQAGFLNVVACLGTAVTLSHLASLWRVCPNPLFCFDGDAAGMNAASRVIDLVLSLSDSPGSVHFSLLPEKTDPDDLIRSGGPAAFRSVLEEALPLCDMLWKREIGRISLDTPEDCTRLEKNIGKVISSIPDVALRFHYTREMRHRLRNLFRNSSKNDFLSTPQKNIDFSGSSFLSSPILRSSLGLGVGKAFRVSQNLGQSALVKKSCTARMPLREAVIVVTLVHHPFLAEEFFDEIERISLSCHQVENLLSVILDVMARGTPYDTSVLIKALCDARLQAVFEKACESVRRAGHWPALPEAEREDARYAFLQVLKLQHLNKTMRVELDEREKDFAHDPGEKKYRSLVDAHSEFHDMQGKDALIDGFGVVSGRTSEN